MPARCHNTIIKEHDRRSTRTLEFVHVVQCPRPGGRRATMHALSTSIYIYLSVPDYLYAIANQYDARPGCMRLLATRASTSILNARKGLTWNPRAAAMSDA
jgi:hypothetical protein